jgi:hypothetical protein
MILNRTAIRPTAPRRQKIVGGRPLTIERLRTDCDYPADLCGMAQALMLAVAGLGEVRLALPRFQKRSEESSRKPIRALSRFLSKC